jgi:hypothetical protein
MIAQPPFMRFQPSGKSAVGTPQSTILLDLPVQRMPPIEPAVFLHLNPVRLHLLVARGRVITTLALRTGQYG